MEDQKCMFCMIASGEISSRTVYEDEDVKAFLDINPASEGHTLIIPKAHYENIYDLPEELLKKIAVVSKKLAIKYKRALKCDGANVVQSSGRAAQQDMFHYHMHLIPRYISDKVEFYWNSDEKVKRMLDQIHKKLNKA